ncbi:SGF29 tudor-like domain-containing protein [Pelagophyceae sp. CCMP2097]|nr:SGF29 tudor-like domain-containing protein [Pelagophyceae sp. CCMP2097]
MPRKRKAEPAAACEAAPRPAAVGGDVLRAVANVHATLAQDGIGRCLRAAAEIKSAGGGADDGAARLAAVYWVGLEWTKRLAADVDAALADAALDRPLRVDDEVAAKVASHGLWILARVTRVEGLTIEVEDVDDERLRRYALRRSDLVTLPREPHELARFGAAARAAYKTGGAVFAMYPDTTSFYRARVAVGGESHLSNGRDVCLVRFQDDEDETGLVPCRPIPLQFIAAVPPNT